MVLTDETLLKSNIEQETFTNIASFLVGHRTNSVMTAARYWGVPYASHDAVIADLNRIGIFRCWKCGLWYWQDQMEDGVCVILCKGL